MIPPISITETIQVDLLIVGSGIAGLVCSIEAHKKQLSHILITKTKLGTGASFFPLKATLGIQVTGDKTDKQLFKKDIYRTGQGMNNAKIVETYIEESSQAIPLLAEIGFKPRLRQDNRPACFAHYSRPIYLINDWVKSAKRAKETLSQNQTPTYENATLLHIVTENNQVQGAVFSYKNEQDKIIYIFCYTSQIILATGGVAGLYKDNLYPSDIIGSTHFIALQAGAKLTNLEFIQFIPSFVKPKYKVLFGEHTLKYCYAVEGENRHNLFKQLNNMHFQKMIHERSTYAPFSIDYPSAQFDLTIMKYIIDNPTADSVYVHFSSELYQNKEDFYQVYLNWLKNEIGIDLLTDKISIAPFAHSCNGGIEVDENGQSCVNGLFAVGEISACIEGANRLGGNSVGGSLVFAKRAIQKAIENRIYSTFSLNIEDAIKQGEKSLNNLNQQTIVKDNKELNAGNILSQIRKTMSKFANVYRSKYYLSQLFNNLITLEKQFDPLAQIPHKGIEIYYGLKTAQVIVQSMLMREESRGAHYRVDFPDKLQDRPYRLQISLKNKSVIIKKVAVNNE